MKRRRGLKCKHCKELYKPDKRNAKRQRYCCKSGCRRAAKAASQRRWRNRAENRNYFRGPENVRRVQEWRAKHPGYSRSRRTKSEVPLQEVKTGQVIERREESGGYLNSALQEVYLEQPLVLLGLIAKLSGTTLQEDIVLMSRSLVRLGQDIISMQGEEYAKAASCSRSSAESAEAV